MDSYFPKTRRPTVGLLTNKLKRPPPSVTPPNAAKIPKTPQTPKDARLNRPQQPPPVKRKSQLSIGASVSDPFAGRTPTKERERPIAIKELFKSAHQVAKPTTPSKSASSTPIKPNAPLALPISRQQVQSGKPSTTRPSIEDTNHSSPDEDRLARPLTVSRELFSKTTSHPLETPPLDEPVSPSKINSGPLKGVSTSLLDLIRAKEAAAKNCDPQLERRRELLGIAPQIVRIVLTVFTTSKKEVIPYDTVIDKCFKGLKSNYTSSTISDCLDLMDKVAPEWVSTVKISRGRFMRINRDNYTIPQLLESIRRYKAKNC